jgi:hypothetical protein
VADQKAIKQPLKSLLCFCLYTVICFLQTSVITKTDERKTKKVKKLLIIYLTVRKRILGAPIKLGTTKMAMTALVWWSLLSKYDISLARTSYNQTETGIILGKKNLK